MAATALLGVGVVFTEVMAFVIWAMRCDETCSPTPSPGRPAWRSNEDAWQWDFQLAWATSFFLMIPIAFRLARRGRVRASMATAAAAVASFLGWLAFVW